MVFLLKKAVLGVLQVGSNFGAEGNLDERLKIWHVPSVKWHVPSVKFPFQPFVEIWGRKNFLTFRVSNSLNIVILALTSIAE